MSCIADADIAEALVCHLWRERLPRRRRLRLTDGRQVRVSCPGDPNPDSGPDFLNAELAFGPGQPVRGDVEVHVRPSDWHRHGHQTDPRYNAVILHVVMWGDDGQTAVVKQNGQRVPTLVLSESLGGSFDRLRRRFERGKEPAHPAYPCEPIAEREPLPALRRRLEEAGDARFLLKARAYEARLTSVSPEQALYEGLMAAAGYAKNTAPFQDLAERLPIAVIRDLLHGLPVHDRIPAVQALLFGAAGLLPSQAEDVSPSVETRHVASLQPFPLTALETRWLSLCRAHSLRPIEATAWQFFRLRPFNFPTVRLAGMSYLAAAGLPEGLEIPFLSAFNEQTGQPPSVRLRALRAALDRLLRHDPADYWVTHSTWNGATHAGRSRLIGIDRRRDMIVNVVLPFLFACARRAGRPDQHPSILDLYAIHPKLAENTITRQMAALLFRRAPDRARIIDSARLQQGLLHIYKQTCWRKACGECVFGGQDSGVRGQD